MNGPNRNLPLTNSLGMGDDSHGPVHLQLSQPQQNHETPARATKLGYNSLHSHIMRIMTTNFLFIISNLLFKNLDPKLIFLTLQQTTTALMKMQKLLTGITSCLSTKWIMVRNYASIAMMWYKRRKIISKKTLWNGRHLTGVLWSKTRDSHVKIKIKYSEKSLKSNFICIEYFIAWNNLHSLNMSLSLKWALKVNACTQYFSNKLVVLQIWSNNATRSSYFHKTS